MHKTCTGKNYDRAKCFKLTKTTVRRGVVRVRGRCGDESEGHNTTAISRVRQIIDHDPKTLSGNQEPAMASRMKEIEN